MQLAVIDIGSNTIKMNIYNSSKGKLTDLYTKTENTGLINYYENGILSEKGIRVLSDTVADLAAEAGRKKCFYVFPFATASIRRASNSAEIIEKVKQSTGFTIDLLDGKDEAIFSFAGISRALGKSMPKVGLMADMGGGSTEIVSFGEKGALSSVSLDVGVLAMYNDYVRDILPGSGECKAMRKFSYSAFKKVDFVRNSRSDLYMVGGTAKAAAKLHACLNHRPFELPYVLDRADLDRLLEKILSKDDKSAKIAAISEIPSRIHTVCPGICAISELMRAAGSEKLTVVQASVREGYAMYSAKLHAIN